MEDEVFGLIQKEENFQKRTLRLIPSENYVSSEVLRALGSGLGNRYSEGYPQKRYYQGQEFVDEIESLAIERAQKVFGVPFANVQPYSGSVANSAVYFGLLEPGDTIMGMSLDSGGHLTHGMPKITFSGKFFNSVSYAVSEDGSLDYEKVRNLALEYKPKLIISGATAYPRTIDFEKFGQIATEVSAFHMADISHIAGLVATGTHPSPVDFADVITTTTHKTLRGPKGALIMVTSRGLAKDPNLSSKINKAVFPGMQGGPHENNIAGIAVCLLEAQEPEFAQYAQKVISNASTLAYELTSRGFSLLTGGTDNHLILVDVRNKVPDGWFLAWALEYAGIIVNRNAIPFDPNPPFYPSGIRLGTPAITTAGLSEKHMSTIANWIDAVAKATSRIVSEAIPENKIEGIDKVARSQIKEQLSQDDTILGISSQIEKFCQENYCFPFN